MVGDMRTKRHGRIRSDVMARRMIKHEEKTMGKLIMVRMVTRPTMELIIW